MVIITRDRADELGRTLNALADTSPDVPVIVINNGGTDHTDAVVESCEPKLPGLIQIKLDHNAGAVARNLGVRAAGTRHVAFCDDDSWWEPGALDAAVEILDANPRVGAVIGRTLVGDDRTPDPINDQLRTSPLATGPDDLPGPRVLGFLACAAVVRTEAFLAAGGFSPILGFAGEEQLLAMDMASNGWPMCYCDTVTVRHLPSAKRDSARRRSGRQLVNSWLVDVMRRPAGTAWRSSAELAAAAIAGAIPVGPLAHGARRLPQAIAARHTVDARLERDIRLLETA